MATTQQHVACDGRGVISGYASRFGVRDYHHDQVMQGAFAKTLRAWRLMGKWPKMLWQHEGQQPIGLWTHMEERDQGLWVEGQLALETQQGREAYHLVKMGAMEGLSIGFRVIKAQKEGQGTGRRIYDLDLLEVSLVTFPANGRAQIEDIKRR